MMSMKRAVIVEQENTAQELGKDVGAEDIQERATCYL